jgi:hypothetical protein
MVCRNRWRSSIILLYLILPTSPALREIDPR